MVAGNAESVLRGQSNNHEWPDRRRLRNHFWRSNCPIYRRRAVTQWSSDCKAKGTCNHQDHAGVGAAIPDGLQTFRIEKLKEIGSNAYRTTHNPPTTELLDACDRLGMLVLDETRRTGSDREALDQLESLIRRDRNHPCVFLWSLANEEVHDNFQGDNKFGGPICKAMVDLAHQLDPSRLCTAAMSGGWGEGFSKVVDVQGFNYAFPGVFGKWPSLTLDQFRAAFSAETLSWH